MDHYHGKERNDSHEMLASRLQRLRRVLGFAGRRVQAIRRDHDAFWAVPGEQAPALPPELADLVQGFKAKADLALRLLEAGEQTLREAERLPPAAAIMCTGRYDPDVLSHTVRELDGLIAGVQAAARSFEALALALPPRPAAPAAVVEPAEPARPQVGPLVRWLQTLADPLLAPAKPPPPAPPGPRDLYLKELEAACETVRQVLDEIAVELVVLRAALDATGLPTKRRPWGEVPATLADLTVRLGLSPVQQSWLLPVAKRLYIDEVAVRRTHIAVTQALEAHRLLAEGARQRKLIPSVGAQRLPAAIAEFHPGKLRAAALPLCRLHVTFADVPVLCRLFPAPAKSGG